jgi:hypothetical protein
VFRHVQLSRCIRRDISCLFDVTAITLCKRRTRMGCRCARSRPSRRRRSRPVMAAVYACRSRGTMTGWGAKARVSIRPINASMSAVRRSVKIPCVHPLPRALPLSRALDRFLVCVVTTCRCRAVAVLLDGAAVPTVGTSSRTP